MDRLLRITAMALSGATLVWLSGCGGPASSSGGDAKPKSGLAAEIERRNAAQAAEEQAAAAAAQAAEAERLANEEPSVVTEDDFKKGKSLKDGGNLSQVARARFVAEHRITMDIQLQHAMALFNASEGRFPKSHEEFMEKIIKPNGIKLPELDGPYEYVYNPDDHKLYKQTIARGDAERAESDGE